MPEPRAVTAVGIRIAVQQRCAIAAVSKRHSPAIYTQCGRGMARIGARIAQQVVEVVVQAHTENRIAVFREKIGRRRIASAEEATNGGAEQRIAYGEDLLPAVAVLPE